MNCHQVLTGAVNSGDNCYSVGSVEGIPFVAYSSGCNVVILSSGFQRVQIIAGILYGNIQVNCIDCSTDVGKIGAAYGHKICVFEPTPLLHQVSTHKLDYKWIQTACIETDSEVSVISWNLEGNKLLTGGHTIQMWHLVTQSPNNSNEIHLKTDSNENHIEKEVESREWECVWQCTTSTPVHFLRFSPDGTLFVSAGKSDRLVKIWYESAAKNSPIAKTLLGRAQENESHQQVPQTSVDVDFSFIYIAHPRAVTGISWRKVSKYMPRGSVANMLVTSCRDNICRLWVQTLLPEDGLVNLSQIEGLSNYVVPRAQTQRHRQKIMQRLKQMKSLSQFKKRQQVTTDESPLNGVISTLPSTFSVHDFHSYGIHGTAMAPGLHFHLTASINAETDIPLVPSLSTNTNGTDSPTKPSFVVHWLNNKDMFFTQSAEKILREISLKIIESETHLPNSDVGSDTGEADGPDTDLETDGASITTAESNRKFRKPIPQSNKKGSKQLNKALSPDDVDHEDSHHINSRQSFHTNSSSNSLATELNAGNVGNHSQIGDLLDRKLEALLREWHNNSDLLFSIHPLDGSLLVWLIEWLDETCPSSFRQPQISFSSRIPNAIPLGDAATMSHNIALYSPHFYLDLKSALITKSSSHESDIESKDVNKTNAIKAETTPFVVQTPTVCLLTKHINGSLNLWNLGFAEGSHFTQVLSISHSSRMCGHRFRVNDVTCHPVLPLLLTTSHHNLPGILPLNEEISAESSVTNSPSHSPSSPYPKTGLQNTGFCSELILWRVDAVGPLSKSGGVTELARINSLQLSAFSNVAWIPTLLPSTTLGSISNSPSACFVASDGKQLRIYQAVIDARTLLAEVSSAERKTRKKRDISPSISDDSTSSEAGQYKHVVRDSFKVVSLQSTARPGCILELNAISDAVHDWKNTQLLHVFQEQLIRGDSSDAYQSWNEKQMNQKGLADSSLGAVVDLRHSAVFEEPFYLVVIEKNESQQSVLHMWRLMIASQPQEGSAKYSYVPDSNIVQENSDHSNTTSRSNSPDVIEKQENPSERVNQNQSQPNIVSPLRITTDKVCTQVLPLPPEVEVIHATPAAGHLSSSNIYPACFAPYLLVTACSDGKIRFWRCSTHESDPINAYNWVEWEMLMKAEESSAFEVPGLPLYVSCAYNGRVACAYKQGKAFSRSNSRNQSQKYINVTLAIIECESTGGSEWVLEDTIQIKNIPLPQTDLNLGIDLGPLVDTSLRNKMTSNTLISRLTSGGDEHTTEHRGTNNIQRLLSVPSYTTMQSLKRIISEKGNQFTLTQKSLVQLDWVSTEDGSHILTVSAGSKITLFTPVSTDIAQANLQTMKTNEKTINTSSNRLLLKQASSMGPLTKTDEIRWMTLRSTDLITADGLPPLPMELSWVRDGILVVGMDNEMLIYTQWKSNTPIGSVESTIEITESRVLTEQELLTHAQESSQLRLPAHPSAIPRSPSFNKYGTNDHKKGSTAQTTQPTEEPPNEPKIPNLSHLPDFGIFETSRLACPVLPQYHPKQLMELLAFGKIQRVRAILGHLVACLASMNSKKDYLQYPQNFGQSFEKRSESERSPRSWLRSRTLSVAAPTSPLQQNSPHESENFPIIAEEVQLDYTEITSIRPLPLYALIEADDRNEFQTKDKSMDEDLDYDNLFDSNFKTQVEETLDEILGRSAFSFNTKPKKASQNQRDITNFGLSQARILTKLLTHSHLPGLSSLDQMHLLALADSVASFNPNANKASTSDDINSKDDSGTESIPINNSNFSADSLDNCGLRFLLTMRQHIYLLRCLPLVQRKGLQKSGLGTHNIVWAFHSETQEELVQMIASIQRDKSSWSELREIGVGFWVRNNSILRKLIENLAIAAFKKNQNPLDAAIYYLMMKKKSLVWGLFRSVADRKMTDFFQNNFSEDKWRKAALKNAYALMGKQRFEHAAAFFLLAGSVWDAVEVCLSKLDDLQLAMVIIRLYEGHIETIPENLKRLLFQEVLGRKRDGSDYKPSEAHPDPFLRSMAYWMLQDYNGALSTLLEIDIGTNHSKYCDDDVDSDGVSISPSVFNFYLYLRTQPLIVRRQFAQNIKDKKEQFANASRGLIHETTYGSDAITPFERRLFFLTAHSHFRAGCPSLALEVLSRLPNRIESNDRKENDSFSFEAKEDKIEPPIATGALPNGDIDGGLDWGAPTRGFDPIDTSDFQFSVEPCSDDEDSNGGLEMKIKDVANDQQIKEQQNDDKEVKLDIMAQQLKFIACLKILMEELSTLATGFEVDGGQLRYHLYVWLEKSVQALKAICNYRTFSMRHSTEDRLNTSMVLGSNEISPSDRITPRGSHSEGSGVTETKPSLHEILLADKMDFEAKLDRSSRRKLWLTSNEALMRTLLSYCSLHGAHGGGLSSVRMELILLLQELQQERSQQQLLSPLPFPTTLPLLAASVACQKTVIADPIRHLQSVTHDILNTVLDMSCPPLTITPNYSLVYVLRDLGISLSSCIYQSLCDSDAITSKPGVQTSHDLTSSVVFQNSHLLAGHQTVRRNVSTASETNETLTPITPPNKWPGVQSLRALLARDKDEDSPKLHTLLCEAFVAVYLSQLIYSLAACDSYVLYRLIGLDFKETSWSQLFGGGAKKLIHVATGQTPKPQPESQQSNEEPESSSLDFISNLSKQRMKLHMKILQQLSQTDKPIPPPNIKEDRPTYREQFIPPQTSMVSLLMTKPTLPDELIHIDYDSSESVVSEDENVDNDLDEFNATTDSVFAESTAAHQGSTAIDEKKLEQEVYAWGIIRLCVMRLARHQLIHFLSISGVELPDLPTTSPLIHSVFKILNNWTKYMTDFMNEFNGPPHHFLTNTFVDTNRVGGPAIHKYKALLELNNTPFRDHNTITKASKRLWNYLVRQERVQDVFIRYIFGKPKAIRTQMSEMGSANDVSDAHNPEPTRIVHKDQENISAFCINRTNHGLIAISTPKEIQELDISKLLEPVPFLEDEAEYDILSLNRSPESLPSIDYLLVQHPADRIQSSPGGLAIQSSMVSNTNISNSTNATQTQKNPIMTKHHFPGNTSPHFCQYIFERSRHVFRPLKRHKTEGVRRLCSHPMLPLYLSGSQDGSVTLWEWNHQQSIANPRAAGTFAKVTRVGFNQQGNKFGVTDSDGNLSLWQVVNTQNKPFFNIQSHSKNASDFTFLGASSLVMTAGQSADHKNIALWDTLLPQKKCLVTSFACHEHNGASAILYAPLNQLLITGGKKGDVFVFDMRQRVQRDKFQAHDSAVKCMALDPQEEFFVTGSADGDIKVWGLGSVRILFYSFPGEHSKSSLFRNIGMGVSHLYVDQNGRLFSCGADGSMKFRQLPDRGINNIINTI